MITVPFVAIAFALVSGSPAPRPADDGQAATRPINCTFANPSYSGNCNEQASATPDQSPNEACQPILACLNDVQCIKTFCNATQIRGGWRLVSAQEASGNN